MAIFISSNNNKPNSDESKKVEVVSQHHDSNNKSTESKNMSESMNMGGIPFSIPFPGTEHKSHGGMWDNPFMYLLFLWIFNGNNGFGWNRNGMGPVGAGMAETQAINSVQIDDIRTKLAETAAEVACGNKSVDGLACSLQGLGIQVGNVKDAVLQGINSIDKSLSSGNMQLAQQIADCCCGVKSALASGFCGVEKEILRQGNAIEAGFAQVGFGQANVVNALSNGFSNIGFQNERNTNQIVQAIQNESSSTRQLMAQYHNEDIVAQKDAQIAKLYAKNEELARAAQSAYIVSQLKTTTSPTT
jgi:hypothetical protein